MRTKIIDENSISCIPEDSDDLIALRRVIKKGDKIVGEIDDKECKNICNSLTKWNIPVNEPRGVDYAEVMIGGVRTHSINPQTLESYICPGLYFCGEIIDVHGDLGGYNFQWAWASGTVAGKSLHCI